jgi:hypothetical protein
VLRPRLGIACEMPGFSGFPLLFRGVELLGQGCVLGWEEEGWEGKAACLKTQSCPA